ncbi:hypothetical protein E1B28_001922 [Marasmius oreades]|uniref:MYND-type domain-containing protein n=1 Tax=Marasmius oreades TaxID=181124 RepID=A0A9P7V4J8_9AGAR|nr:uncharacterized protein E1B28_001922 [Marasmius oreades]KAG7100143.1 hypothetical protein E1B28_001922 [Marasmius oreades]
MTPRTRRGSKFPSQYDDHILDPYFMDKAIQRFPTPRSAIDGLRLIEKPQKGLLYTLSYPGGDVETFLAVAASLAECMRGNRQEQQVAVILLRNNWISLIGPWVMTTIEELILPDLEPDAPAISTIREQAMWILPYLLYPPKLFTRIEFSIRELRDLTPDLALFLSRVWVNVIDRHHRTWGLWTNLLASLARGDLVQGPAHLTTHKVFESLHPLGHIFLRHLNYETPHVPTMDDDQLIEFNNFLLLTNCDQYGGRGPLNMEGVEKYALPALVRVVSCLLYKRKMLREHGVDSEREGSIVMLVLDNIYRMMDGFVRVSEALEAGITVALIRAYPLYFELDPRPPCPELDQERPPRFEEQALKILERIAKYLVFPVVLHQFLRLSKRVMWSKEMEKQLRSKSKALWTAWKQAQNKAIILRDIRRSLIADGCFWKCSNTSCKSSYGNSGVKFLRCSGCLGVVYCSRNCQALHWNHDHRKKCGETSRLRDCEGLYLSSRFQSHPRLYKLDYHIPLLAINCSFNASPTISWMKMRRQSPVDLQNTSALSIRPT